MNMSLSLNTSLELICTICDRPMDDHSSNCITKLISDLADRVKLIACPKCHQKKILPNRADLFECQSCHAQFCSGAATPGYDAEKLKDAILLDYHTNNAIYVKEIPDKGKGDFPLLQALARLNKERDGILKTKGLDPSNISLPSE